MYSEANYGDLWNELDELLIEYPELSELWLDRAKLAALRVRFTSRDELREYFRKRAFTALVMEKIFRVYESNAEEGNIGGDGTEGEEEEETITIDNEELRSIWQQDVKDEYSDFPEFIDYVEKNIFVSG